MGSAHRAVPVAGAVPFSLPTADDGRPGELVHLPSDQPVTPATSTPG